MAKRGNNNRNRNNNRSRNNNRGGGLNLGSRNSGGGNNQRGGNSGRGGNNAVNNRSNNRQNSRNNNNRQQSNQGNFNPNVPRAAGGPSPWQFGERGYGPDGQLTPTGSLPVRGVDVPTYGGPGREDFLYKNAGNNHERWLATNAGREILADRFGGDFGAALEAGRRDAMGEGRIGEGWRDYLAMVNYQNGQVGTKAIETAIKNGASSDDIQGFLNRTGFKAGEDAQRYGYGNASQLGGMADGVNTGQNGTQQGVNTGTGYRAAMSDGKISRKDIEARLDAKGIKGNKRANAQMRIADRWSGKGGFLGGGVLRDYIGNYQDKNPYMAMAIKSGANPYGMFDANIKGKSRNDLYGAASRMLDSKAYKKGDVFDRLKDGNLRALPYTRQLSIGGNSTDTTNTSTNTNTNTGNYTGYVDSGAGAGGGGGGGGETSGPGMMSGGGLGLTGATFLGRPKSRFKRLGLNNQGMNALNRMFINYQNTLN